MHVNVRDGTGPQNWARDRVAHTRHTHARRRGRLKRRPYYGRDGQLAHRDDDCCYTRQQAFTSYAPACATVWPEHEQPNFTTVSHHRPVSRAIKYCGRGEWRCICDGTLEKNENSSLSHVPEHCGRVAIIIFCTQILFIITLSVIYPGICRAAWVLRLCHWMVSKKNQ